MQTVNVKEKEFPISPHLDIMESLSPNKISPKWSIFPLAPKKGKIYATMKKRMQSILIRKTKKLEIHR